jgi:pyruvate,water dikinase
VAHQDGGADRRAGALQVPDLPEYEDDEVAFEDGRNTAFYEVLDAYGRLLRLGDLMWQHHFEFLLLGYGAYATFAEFCKTHLPDIPDQHIAQMVAGIDVLLFRPDAELRRLARPRNRAGRRRRLRGGPDAGRDRRRARGRRGRTRLARRARGGQGPVVQHGHRRRPDHYYRSWLDDPSIPFASITGHIAAQRTGAQIERPTEEIERERDRLAEEYGALLPEEVRGPFNDLLALSRTVFPYVEEHKFYLRLLVPDRWWNKIREFGALLARHGFLEDGEDIFQLTRHEVASALDELVLTWATGGRPLGPAALAPDRRSPQAAARAPRALDPAAGARRDAGGDHRSDDDHAVGRDDRTRAGVGAPAGRRRRAERRGRLAGDDRGDRKRVVRRSTRSPTSATARSSSAAAPRRPGRRSSRRSRATVTDVGGVMSHAAIVCREYGLPAVVGTGRATTQIRTGQRIRVDGTAGVVAILEP